MKSFRSWNPGGSWWREPVSASRKSEISGTDSRIGIVVDAGPSLGYGHAVRCLRLANALADDAAVIVYPLSEICRDFFLNASPAAKFEICLEGLRGSVELRVDADYDMRIHRIIANHG